MKKITLLAIAAALLGMGATASAAPSCTNWMKQNNGTYWRTCVDDKGRQYCQQSYRGRITRVVCR